MSIEFDEQMNTKDLYPPPKPPHHPIEFPPGFKIHAFKTPLEKVKPRSLWHRDRHFDRFVNGHATDPQFVDYEYYPIVASYATDCHGNECPDEISSKKLQGYIFPPKNYHSETIDYQYQSPNYVPLIIMAILIIVVLTAYRS